MKEKEEKQEKEAFESEERSDDRLDGDVKIKLPISKKLENFWYHYKWHTIATLFVLIVGIVITFQLCSREDYDVYVLYAGDKSVSGSSSDGNLPERNLFLNSVGAACPDFDKNGKVNVAFKSLFCPDAEELERRKAEGLEIPDKLIYDDAKLLASLLAQSEYYLLFLDRAVFESSAKSSDMISAIDCYLPDGWSGRIVRAGSGSGIYLSETAFYGMEGVRNLPSDTIICIKKTNAFASDSEKQRHADAVQVFKNIVAMG